MSKFTISQKHKGSIAVEYMVLTVFIGLALIAGATALGNSLNTGLSDVGSSISNILGGGRGGGGGGLADAHPFDPLTDTDIKYFQGALQQQFDVLKDTETGQQYYIGADGITQHYLEENAGYMVATDKDGQAFVYLKL